MPKVRGRACARARVCRYIYVFGRSLSLVLGKSQPLVPFDATERGYFR